jgi:2,3-bisphosphoglycerate-independent phosphoglycerate mutase
MKVGLVILDGWGINPDPDARNAVAAADTPTVDRLESVGATATLRTDGPHVGLPPGQMGNSEVGHLTIGAGRVVTQESARITDAIERWRGSQRSFESSRDPPIDENPVLDSLLEAADRSGGRLHLLGLVSDGGVHASQDHLHALIELAADRGIDAVTHVITDGRDTPPKSGIEFVRTLQSHVDSTGTGSIATVSGRYYAMDRDENWDRTERAYDAIVNRESEFSAPSGVAAVREAYDRGTTDEFIEPTCLDGGPPLTDCDGVIFLNFRADRARQLTRLLANIDPPIDIDPPDARLVTMT